MDKIKAGYVEGIVSIIVNLALFAAKMWAGIVTGSIALVADAWHTLSDSISSVVVIASVGLSSRKADSEHPFGHGRYDHVAALFVAFILGIIAYNFARDSVSRFLNREAASFGLGAIIVTSISIVVKEALAQYAFYLAGKTGNMSVKADGWHHRTDALSSVVVLAGIFFAKRFWWIDSALGAVVALMLFWAAISIVRETITKILGEKPDDALIEKLTEEAKSVYHKDMQFHHFHVHNYVLHKELTFHIRLDSLMSIEEAHEITVEMEKRIEEKFGIISTIHVEPLHY
jgi:cation diffusion facilitator family transporter